MWTLKEVLSADLLWFVSLERKNGCCGIPLLWTQNIFHQLASRVLDLAGLDRDAGLTLAWSRGCSLGCRLRFYLARPLGPDSRLEWGSPWTCS